eukprot:Trichotokara_eunicae@DN4479_c0_g1_i1.p1
MRRPSDVPTGFTISMFRNNVVPMWEAIPDGGMWMIRMTKESTYKLDSVWEKLVLVMIGEVLDMQQIVGISYSLKTRENLVSVWVQGLSGGDKFIVGERIRDILNLPQSVALQYKHFSQALVDYSSVKNARSYVLTTPSRSPMYDMTRKRVEDELRLPDPLTPTLEAVMVGDKKTEMSTSSEGRKESDISGSS